MAKKKLIKNSIFGTIQVVLTACLTLVSVPVFIKGLGLEIYGVFAVVSVFGNLNFIINFGLNNALLVYVAKQGKCRESDLDIAVTQIILVILIIIISVTAFLFSDFIIEILKIPDDFKHESKKLFYLLIASNSFLLLGHTFSAILDALQKIYITNILQFIYSSVYWIGMILVVTLGGGLAKIGQMALLASVLWFVALFIIVKHVWGKLDLTKVKNEFKRVAIKQLSYGSKIYASGLIGFMFEPLSKILLSNFIGLNAVALYEIGLKVRGQISSIFSKTFYPLLPFIANSEVNAELKSKVFDLSKKIQLIVIPVSFIMAFVLTILVKLWLGSENYEQASIFVITLTEIVLLFSLPIVPIYQYLTAKNKAEKTILIQLSSVVVNLVLFMLLYKITGLYSILIANLAGYLASFALGNYYQHKYIGARFWNDRLYYIKLLLMGFSGLIICYIIRFFIPIGLWDLIIYPIAVGGIFILFVRKLKLITNNDLKTYFSTMPLLKNRLNILFIS